MLTTAYRNQAIAPTASSLSLGIGSFLNEEFALRRELLLLLVSLPTSFFLDFNKEVNFPPID